MGQNGSHIDYKLTRSLNQDRDGFDCGIVFKQIHKEPYTLTLTTERDLLSLSPNGPGRNRITCVVDGISSGVLNNAAVFYFNSHDSVSKADTKVTVKIKMTRMFSDKEDKVRARESGSKVVTVKDRYSVNVGTYRSIILQEKCC
jgi:hypothetical protein